MKSLQALSAIGMLIAGVSLSVAGFIMPPRGEISDSVLQFFAECLIYAGSIFGVSAYYQGKFTELRNMVEDKLGLSHGAVSKVRFWPSLS